MTWLVFIQIILTLRDDEDTWARSFSHQFKAEDMLLVLLIILLSPSANKYGHFRALTGKYAR